MGVAIAAGAKATIAVAPKSVTYFSSIITKEK
jgi:hypothetical protein